MLDNGNSPSPIDDPRGIPAGTPIYLNVGFYRHIGIVSDRKMHGKPMVLEKSLKRGRAMEVTWDTFSNGQPIYRYDIQSNTNAQNAIRNARSKLGETWTPWNNCEHFVRESLCVDSSSPQLQTTAIFTGLSAILLLISIKSR